MRWMPDLFKKQKKHDIIYPDEQRAMDSIARKGWQAKLEEQQGNEPVQLYERTGVNLINPSKYRLDNTVDDLEKQQRGLTANRPPIRRGFGDYLFGTQTLGAEELQNHKSQYNNNQGKHGGKV